MLNIVMHIHGTSYTVERALGTLLLNTKAQFSLLAANGVGATTEPLLRDFLENNPVTGGLVKADKDDPLGEGVKQSEKWFGRGERLYICDDLSWFTPGWLQVLTQALDSFDRFGIVSGGDDSLCMSWHTWDRLMPEGLVSAVAKGIEIGILVPPVVEKIDLELDSKGLGRARTHSGGRGKGNHVGSHRIV